MRKQNYDYGQYVLTALFHESWITEPWEETKQEADMETYYWSRNQSKVSSEAILNWAQPADQPKKEVPAEYVTSIETVINDGENEQNLFSYKQAVLNLLNLPVHAGK